MALLLQINDDREPTHAHVVAHTYILTMWEAE